LAESDYIDVGLSESIDLIGDSRGGIVDPSFSVIESSVPTPYIHFEVVLDEVEESMFGGYPVHEHSLFVRFWHMQV
jgi:hypothetical protein